MEEYGHTDKEERIDWFSLGKLSASSRRLQNVAKPGDKYSDAVGGQTLYQYLLDAVKVDTGIGQGCQVSRNEYGVQTGAQITNKEPKVSRIISLGDKARVAVGRKLDPMWTSKLSQLFQAYAQETGDRAYDAMELYQQFSRRDVVVSPVSLGEECRIKDEGAPRTASVQALKWTADKETRELKCEVHMQSSNSGSCIYLVEDFAQKFVPSRLYLSGGSSEKQASHMINVTPQGIIRPIEINQSLGNSLVVDNCYVYHVANGRIIIVGFWEHKRINFGMSEDQVSDMVKQAKSVDSYDMVGPSSPFYKAYKQLKGSIPYLSQLRHLIAPYMSIQTNWVSSES